MPSAAGVAILRHMVLVFLPVPKKEAEGLPNVWGWVMRWVEGAAEENEYFETSPEGLRKEAKWGCRGGRRTTYLLAPPTSPHPHTPQSILNLSHKPMAPSKRDFNSPSSSAPSSPFPWLLRGDPLLSPQNHCWQRVRQWEGEWGWGRGSQRFIRLLNLIY